MIIFTIIISLIITGVIYVLLIFGTTICRSFLVVTTSGEVRQNYGRSILFTSCLIAGFTSFFFLFTSPAKNYKNAYIEPDQQGYKVTVRGKRTVMAHDPITPFLRQTSEDSAQFLLPRSIGIIKADELQTIDGLNTFEGNFSIEKDHLSVNLTFVESAYDLYDWNGEYNLMWR